MYSRATRRDLASCLADALLAGDWEREFLQARCDDALEPAPSWGPQLIAAVLRAHPHQPPRDRRRELVALIERWLAPRAIGRDVAGEPERAPLPRHWCPPAPQLGNGAWSVPPIATPGELAAALALTDGQLAWLADTRSWERTATAARLRNYNYLVLPRPGRNPRLVEQPKPRLKRAQRWILDQLLADVPLHPAAHGFVAGRSPLTHAAAHSGRRVVISLDLQSFFSSITAARVYGVFRLLGYPEEVARTLAGLTTNTVPRTIWNAVPAPDDSPSRAAHASFGERLRRPHLPQGAPSSPALANLVAFTLDRRLSGLAATVGATYTRYADDLTFSGERELLAAADRLRSLVTRIAADEGFTVNDRKSRLTTRAGRQHSCGLVLNVHPNVARRDYDTLKATLHNCIRGGPADQNRDAIPDFRAHLLGRISWVAASNPVRGARLRAQFDQIVWSGPGLAGPGPETSVA